MTKLPETISKRVSVFSGKSEDEAMRHGRCVGGTTTVALSLLAVAQSKGAAFSFDFDNYENSRRKTAASHLMSHCQEIVDKLGYRGFTFRVCNLEGTRGLVGLDHGRIHCSYSHLNPYESYGVLVTFNPIVEVHYDLRK